MSFFRSSPPSRAAAVAAAALFLAAPAILTPAPAGARSGPDGFADLAARLLPSVVNISTTQTLKPDKGAEPSEPERPQSAPGSPFDEFFRNFFDHDQLRGERPELRPRRASSLGSGFIIDPKGYVVTNNHVIADADEITVILHDNRNLQASVVGRDKKTDIAVLKVKTDKPLPAASWGDSRTARVGDWVLAIGNPFGLGGSVTAGILSARERDINSGPYDDFLQTDASINRGNSGGPMFNMEGQVIGINTAIYSPSGGSIGIGFAIPSSLAKSVVTELINEADHTVHRGWLGVRIQAVTDEIADSLGLDKARGALVASVADKGPARAAGIRPGDVVLRFDNREVGDIRRLPRLVAETPVGKSVPVTIWRQHKESTVEVKVGQLDESSEKVASAEEEPKKEQPAATVKTLGLTLSPLNSDMRTKFSLSEKEKGVVILDVDKDSAAADKGLRPGDIIVEAAQQEIGDPGQLVDKVAAEKKSGRKSILLLIERKGDLRFVALRLDQS